MSRIDPRESPDYWRPRLFRNSFTVAGVRRRVSGWCMKVQWAGDRRTIRWATEDVDAAAREAAAMYAELRRGGWEAVDRRRRAGGTGWEAGGTVVGVRKYVSDFHPGFQRELFAEISVGGVQEQVALGTEDPEVAERLASEIRGAVKRLGWKWVRDTHPREVTVAVFWQANPMTCTYGTLLSLPRGGVERESTAPRPGRGWRVLVVDPDGPVRRALVRALATAEGVAEARGFGSPGEASAMGLWDVALANRKLGPAALRGLARSATERGQPGEPWVLEHGLYADSDAIFASVSGVSRGYFLKRLPPGRLLEPLVRTFPDGPARSRSDAERQVRRYFQATLEPAEAVLEATGPSFSARETQVLDLLGRGYSDKEIGNELGISVWTVHSHLKRIFGKYGVRTRTEAVVRHLQK